MKTITTEELKEKLDNDEVILIDVLSEKSYETSHIRGALNIPLKLIGFRAKEKYDKGRQDSGVLLRSRLSGQSFGCREAGSPGLH
ncbi:MAG: rhodanese-like domain-containing protein [Bacteroidales bacterium]|nr:rhodanese-like domain-containing protein [Bacteroidales bacterium]